MLKRSTKGLKKTNSNWKVSSKPMKKGIGLSKGKCSLRVKPLSEEAKNARKDQQEKDREFYSSLRDQRGNKSEISGKWLQAELLSVNYHHIISKSSWPEGRYIAQNVIILEWEEHSAVEADIYKYPEINRRRKILQEKYNL